MLHIDGERQARDRIAKLWAEIETHESLAKGFWFRARYRAAGHHVMRAEVKRQAMLMLIKVVDGLYGRGE